MTELSADANSILDRLHKRTGRSKKDLASIAIAKMEMWGPALESLIYESTPQALLEDEAFWAAIRRDVDRGVAQCREKFTRRR